MPTRWSFRTTLLHYRSELAVAAILLRIQLPSSCSCSARMDSLLGLESNGFSLVAKACRSELGLWSMVAVDDSSYWNSHRRIVHSILDKKRRDNPTPVCLVCSTLDYLSVCSVVESLKRWLCLLGNSRPCSQRRLAGLNAKVVMEGFVSSEMHYAAKCFVINWNGGKWEMCPAARIFSDDSVSKKGFLKASDLEAVCLHLNWRNDRRVVRRLDEHVGLKM